MKRPPKATLTLDLKEDFDAPELNREVWTPYYLPHWSSRARTRAVYSLGEGGPGLRLHITEGHEPWNPAFDGDLRVSCLQTGQFSGPVGSRIGQLQFAPGLRVTEAQPVQRLYTPQFGYIETCLKAVALPGYMAALWLMGFEETPEQSGEICVCELFGAEMTPDSIRVGYGIHPFGDLTLRDEFYQDDLPLNPQEFHTYGVHWTPTYCDFFVDDQFVRRINQSPQYPMQFMLALYEVPAQLPATGRSGPWPKTLEVKYVHAYRPQ